MQGTIERMDLSKFETNAVILRVAGVDRLKFNEAVNDKFYRCAPKAAKGTPRQFDFIDVIGLFVFGRLLDFGFPARHAGSYACDLVEALRRSDAECLYIAHDIEKDKRVALTRRPKHNEAHKYLIGLEFNIVAISAELDRRFKEFTAIWKEG